MCDADVDTLQSLIDKSLVRRRDEAGHMRYWMLETIREFAVDRLERLEDQAELRDRHAAWYLTLGERAKPEVWARLGREWHDRLDAEHANLRASLEHLLVCPD